MRLAICCVGAVLAMGLVGCKDDGKTAGEKVGNATDKAVDATKDAAKSVGEGAKDMKDAVVRAAAPSGDDKPDGMRSTLEAVVQNALDKNDFKEMTSHFTNTDRMRLDAAAPDPAALNAKIATFKDNWKKKYNGDVFKVMDADKVYTADFVALTAMKGGDGKNMGKATIAASHGMAELVVPMVGEDGKWRIDLPDEMTGSQVGDTLAKAVDELNGMSAEWPATDLEAYRLVTHHLMMRLLGK